MRKQNKPSPRDIRLSPLNRLTPEERKEYHERHEGNHKRAPEPIKEIIISRKYNPDIIKKKPRRKKHTRRYIPKKRFSKKYKAYLESPEWFAKREEILKRDNYECRECGSPNLLQVHHLNYNNLFDEKPEDLMTLCKPCHEKIHGRKFNAK